MKKLVRGILEFRRQLSPERRDMYAQLALGQKPDTLLIACSDSRVAPNAFASTDPGDMFVLRNVGNIICPCNDEGHSMADLSEGAAIEFAVEILKVQNIIVCGHAECGAMGALMNGLENIKLPHLRRWVELGETTLHAGNMPLVFEGNISVQNRLSQINVLQQIENLKSYPHVREAVAEGRLTLYPWWYDIANAEVQYYDARECKFIPINETTAEDILAGIAPTEAELKQKEQLGFDLKYETAGQGGGKSKG